jgi:integrase
MAAKKGLLRGKVRIGYTPDGKPIDKCVSAHSAHELENVKQAVREHYIFGRPIPKEQLFYEYAETWYRTRKEPFISESSKASYKSAFMKHILPEFGLQNMRAISAQQIQEFVNTFADTSKSQVTIIVGTMKNIFATAYAEGLVERDPTVALIRPKTQRKNDRRALTVDETHRILEVIRTHPEGLLLAVLYYLGVRRGEALGLKWGDFDLTEDQVHIVRDIDYTGSIAQVGDLKTQASDRYIPVPAELKQMLFLNKGKTNEYVFHTDKGAPLPQATFKRIWSRLMLAAGCVEWREKKPDTDREYDILKCIKPTLTPHFFRHNFVTLLYEAGVDPLIAMKIVGHSNYQTTADVYTHIKEDMLKKSTVKLADVFRKREEMK